MHLVKKKSRSRKELNMADSEEKKYRSGVIRLSKLASIIFIALIVMADIGGYPIARYVTYCWIEKFDIMSLVLTTIIFYVATICGYVVIFSVYKLLSNMEKDIVFDTGNTRLMGYITGGLVACGIACACETVIWPGSIFLSIVVWFIALIVLCVKTAFDKAIMMKDEMDLTI